MKYVLMILILLSLLFGALCGRMTEVSSAALSECGNAVELTLALMGAICLWSGLTEIAERAGITQKLSDILAPLVSRLFKGVDKTSRAMRLITMNITANMLGLGNAATPLGIEAMTELSKMSDGGIGAELGKTINKKGKNGFGFSENNSAENDEITDVGTNCTKTGTKLKRESEKTRRLGTKGIETGINIPYKTTLCDKKSFYDRAAKHKMNFVNSAEISKSALQAKISGEKNQIAEKIAAGSAAVSAEETEDGYKTFDKTSDGTYGHKADGVADSEGGERRGSAAGKSDGITANDNMILFTVLNTASIQLIPTTVAALRLKYNSENPFDIIPVVIICSAITLAVTLFVTKTMNRLRPAKEEES